MSNVCLYFRYINNRNSSEEKKLDEIWLVTEFIKGKTLKEMLKCNELSFKEFLDIFAQILVALEIVKTNINFVIMICIQTM